MTQPGETDGYTASMHVKAILDHAGRGVVDYVIVNSAPIPPDIARKYRAKGSVPVKVDADELHRLGVGFVRADIVSKTDAGHHDPAKLTREVVNMIYNLHTSKPRGRHGDYSE